jgi:hypothetical protein
MCDTLAAALMRSDVEHEMLDALMRDLVGKTVDVEFDDTDDAVPSYGYSYFRNIGVVLLNKAGAQLVADALLNNNNGEEALYSLHQKLIFDPKKLEGGDGIDCIASHMKEAS